MKVISLDCETNGLGGQAFAVAAVLVADDGQEIDVWQARCPIYGKVDPWVEGNVLPALASMPVTCAGYGELLTGWRAWYGDARHADDNMCVIGHIVWPVEARFLRDAHSDNLFDGPYPLLDVAPLLLATRHDPTSVDSYLAKHKLPKPDGSPHHPLYDARATECAFRHLMARIQRES